MQEAPTIRASSGQTYRGPFAIMTVLFFMWGFMTVFNDILIPRFKDAFTLDYFHAMLVQFAFFGAYFIGSLLYFAISVVIGDPIARLGYKNGVVIGLLISALGSALFFPAATFLSYPLFLAALFVVGLGFAMLQIAANPYVTILGPERTASSRLNFAQAFNSLGTTLGPLVGGYFIFQYFARTGAHGAASVKVPYLAFFLVFLVLAVIFFFVRLPDVSEGKIERGFAALKFPHVDLGMLAIFMYVGGEVAVGSSIINFLGQPAVAGLTQVQASAYVSPFWFGMLLCRFMGAVELNELAPRPEHLLARHRRHRHLQEPGVIAPGHGNSGRRDPTAGPRPYGRSLEPPAILSCSTHCLHLCRVLRLERTQSRPSRRGQRLAVWRQFFLVTILIRSPSGSSTRKTTRNARSVALSSSPRLLPST